VAAFSGSVGDVDANNLLHFVGPHAVVTIAAGQRLTGAATVALGKTGVVPPFLIQYGLCYQPDAGGALTNFAGSNYILAYVPGSGDRRDYSATASVVPGAGTWRVGFCVINGVDLDNNDYVNGWVMATQ